MKILLLPPPLYCTMSQIIAEGISHLDYTELVTPFKMIGVPESTVYSEDEIAEMKDIDYIFVVYWKAFTSYSAPSVNFRLLDKLKLPDKTVYVDNSSWTYNGYPQPAQLFYARKDPMHLKGSPWIWEKAKEFSRWYFKRECYPEDLEKGILPLPLTVPDSHIIKQKTDKILDVSCLFGDDTLGIRPDIRQFFRESPAVKNDKFLYLRNSNLEDYLLLIASSLMSVDAAGNGGNLLRKWEIVSNKTACVSQKTDLIIPDDFTDGKSIVMFSTVEELKEKIYYYTKNKDKLSEIAMNGYSHFIKYHTPEKRIDYILKNLK